MVLSWLFKSNDLSNTQSEEILQRLEKTRIERELALREALIERKNAYKLAETREKLNWLAPTSLMTILLSSLASYHHKNFFYTLPIIPIIGYMGSQLHLAYGNKLQLIIDGAEKILADSDAILSTRTISVKEVEARIEQQQKMTTIMNVLDITD